jgi:hypothetical protein
LQVKKVNRERHLGVGERLKTEGGRNIAHLLRCGYDFVGVVRDSVASSRIISSAVRLQFAAETAIVEYPS